MKKIMGVIVSLTVLGLYLSANSAYATVNELVVSAEYGTGYPNGLVRLYGWDGTNLIHEGYIGGAIAEGSGWDWSGVGVGDVDNDCDNEIVVGFNVGSDGYVRFYKGSTTTLQEVLPQWHGPGFQYRGLAVGDADNDGMNELVVAVQDNTGLDSVRIYQWDGTKFVHEGSIVEGHSWGWLGVGIGDYDNNGDNELVLSFVTNEAYDTSGRLRGGYDVETYIRAYHLGPPNMNESDVTKRYGTSIPVNDLGGPWYGAVVNAVGVGDLDNNGDNEVVIGLQISGLGGFIEVSHWTTAGLVAGWDIIGGDSLFYFHGLDIGNADNNPPAPDSDNDGVCNAFDECPGTLPGDVVDAYGCSIAQLCPADALYKNHGEYVSCVAQNAEDFVDAGLITEDQKDDIVSAAAQSKVGKPRTGNK